MTYLVSDLHLLNAMHPRSQKFLNWLKALAQEPAGNLILLGDIFDLWIGKHRFFQDEYKDIIQAVTHLISKGWKLRYFEGNHDLYLKEFWEKDLGVIVEPEAQLLELEGKRMLLEHGDLINPEDKGYLFLRSFLRSGPMVWLEPKIPDQLVQWIGAQASSMSRDYNSGERSKVYNNERVRALIRSHALRRAAEQEFDLIITGHVHVEDICDLQFGTRKFTSINLGSWFEKQKTLRISPEGFKFIEI